MSDTPLLAIFEVELEPERPVFGRRLLIFV